MMQAMSTSDLSALAGKSWDDWDVPVTVPDEELQAYRESLRRKYLPQLAGCNGNQNHRKVEPGTFPSSLMSLFGSYPVDDIFSLVTCSCCNLRFRTQTAYHHLNNCPNRLTKEPGLTSSGVSAAPTNTNKDRASIPFEPKNPAVATIEKSVKVCLTSLTDIPSAKLKTSSANTDCMHFVMSPKSKSQSLNETNNDNRSPSSIAAINLVPSLIIKRESLNDSSKSDYKPLPETAQLPLSAVTNLETSYVVKPSSKFNIQDQSKSALLSIRRTGDQLVNKMLVAEQFRNKKKKVVEPPRKLIPLKDRHFSPEEHCGVAAGGDGRPCTRSLTCKTHSIALRRAVIGRSQSFDILLASHKKFRDEAKCAKTGVEKLDEYNKITTTKTSTKDHGIVDRPFIHGLPTTRVKLGSVLMKNKLIKLKSANKSRSIPSDLAPVFRCENPARTNFGISVKELATVEQSNNLEKVITFSQLFRKFSAQFTNENEYKFSCLSDGQYDSCENFEEECWTSIPLEIVNVPRPTQKSAKKKNHLLERWKKGDLCQLELLQEGISKYRNTTLPREKDSANDNNSLRKRCLSPGGYAENKQIKKDSFSGQVSIGDDRKPVSFSISSCGNKSSLSKAAILKSAAAKSKAETVAATTSTNNDSSSKFFSSTRLIGTASGVSDTSANHSNSHTRQLNAHQARRTSSMSAIQNHGLPKDTYNRFVMQKRVDSKQQLESHNILATDFPSTRTAYEQCDKNDRLLQLLNQRNLDEDYQYKIIEPGNPETLPNWITLSQELSGQRSPHDAPVSDSELSNLLAAQFED